MLTLCHGRRPTSPTESDELPAVEPRYPAETPDGDRPPRSSIGADGETKIELALDLDGTGKSDDRHRRRLLRPHADAAARHSLIDLTVQATGDLHVDAHHTVEDVGICFGKALAQALGDKAGIRRYGDATLPMDETLATAAVDLSGRPFCVWKADVPLETLGDVQLDAGGGVLAGRLVQRGVRPARRRPPRPQHAPHHRGDLQGDGPRPARGGGTRPAFAGRAVDEGRAVRRRRDGLEGAGPAGVSWTASAAVSSASFLGCAP